MGKLRNKLYWSGKFAKHPAATAGRIYHFRGGSSAEQASRGTVIRLLLKSGDAFITHLPGNRALVLDSPHSETTYPPDFLYACEMTALRSAEDTHVEKLYDFAPELGVHWIEARTHATSDHTALTG